jgi:hypothetical protein
MTKQTDEEFEIEQEKFDREFCVVAAIVTASLDKFIELGEKHGRDLPEMKIASGLMDYIDELASGLSYSGEREAQDELAANAVVQYLELAAQIPHQAGPAGQPLNPPAPLKDPVTETA